MPLVGTICCQSGTERPFAHCYKECREGRCQHSLPLITAMSGNSEARKNLGITSSTLTGCPRQYVLGKDTDTYEYPEEYYKKWRGSWGHYAMEMTGPYPDVVQETRFYGELDGLKISGQPDWIDLARNRIEDHKTTGRVPSKPYIDHERQVNIYVWLVENGWYYTGVDQDKTARVFRNIHIESAAIHYLDPWKEVIYEVPVWTREAQEQFIRQRLRPIVDYYRTGELPGPLPLDEQWRAKYCPFHGTGRCCMEQTDD